MRTAAIYARVSSEQQREAHTIASQTAALIGGEYARSRGAEGLDRRRLGLSGPPRTARSGRGAICAEDRSILLVYSPDRLSRSMPPILCSKSSPHGVETRF